MPNGKQTNIGYIWNRLESEEGVVSFEVKVGETLLTVGLDEIDQSQE